MSKPKAHAPVVGDDLSLNSDDDPPPISPSPQPISPRPPSPPPASDPTPSKTESQPPSSQAVSDDDGEAVPLVAVTPEAGGIKTPADAILDPGAQSVNAAGRGSLNMRPNDPATQTLATRQEVESKVDDLFGYYAQGNAATIDVSDLVELLGELGFKDIEMEDITTMVIDSDAITASEATDVVMRLLTQNAGADAKLNTIGVTVVQLTPWAYLKMRLTCDQQPHTHYKIDWSSLSLNPSSQLQLAIAFTVLICSALITMTIALQWRDLVDSSESRRVHNVMAVSGSMGSTVELEWTRVTTQSTYNLANLHSQTIATRASSMTAVASTVIANYAGIVKSGVSQVTQSRTAARLRGFALWLRTVANYDAVRQSRGGANTSVILTLASGGPIKDYLGTSGVDLRVVDPSSGRVFSLATVATSCNTNSGQACNVANTPCLTRSSSAGAVFNLTGTRSFNGNTADAVGVVLSNGVRVCAFVESTVLSLTTVTSATAVLETTRPFALVGETTTPLSIGQMGANIARFATRVGNSAVIATTAAELAFLSSCTSSCSFTSSGQMAQDLLTVMVSGGNLSNVGTGVTTREERYTLSPLNGIVIIASSLSSSITAQNTASIVASVNTVNGNMSAQGWRHAPIELGLATTSDVTTPLTILLHADECTTVGCPRYSMALVAQQRALTASDAVSVLQQNYVPRPVMCAAASVTSAGMVFYAEVGLVDIRTAAQRTTLQMLNAANIAAKPLNIEASHVAGTPASSLFATDAACSGDIECVQKGSVVLYRSDCPDCYGVASTDEIIGNASSIEMLTPLTPLQQAYCNGFSPLVAQTACDASQRSAPTLYRKLLHNAFATADVLATSAVEDSAFAVPNAISSTYLVRNLSVQLSTFITVASYQDDAYSALSLAVGMTPILVVVIIIIEMIVTRFILRDIEEEWSQYTTKIQHESQMFSEMVVDIFPIEVAERIMKGAVRISDAAQFTFLFVNIHQFEQLYRSKMEPTILTLFSSYYYLMLSHVAQHFRLYRVRCFGDCVFIVGGISDDTRDTPTLNNTCFRTLQAAAVIIEMFSYMWSHVPSHVPCLREITTSDRPIAMPSCKLGVHVGPAMMIVEPSSKGPPVFDVVGPHVGVAYAAMQAAHLNTVAVTDLVVEGLKAVGPRAVEMFSFKDATRRLPTKVGALRMQLMTAANVPVPPRVVFALGVRRAVTRTFFGESHRPHRNNATDLSTEQSTDSGK